MIKCDNCGIEITDMQGTLCDKCLIEVNIRSSKEFEEELKLNKRYCPVSESLEESLKEMKLMREGKLPKKSWREMFKELEEETT